MKYSEYKEKALKDPEVKEEYEKLGPEYEIIKAVVEGRKKLNITQKELARRTGIPQANICRIETGNYNPSLKVLKRVASGLNRKLHIEFR